MWVSTCVFNVVQCANPVFYKVPLQTKLQDALLAKLAQVRKIQQILITNVTLIALLHNSST
jgi:hypothetical protein